MIGKTTEIPKELPTSISEEIVHQNVVEITTDRVEPTITDSGYFYQPPMDLSTLDPSRMMEDDLDVSTMQPTTITENLAE